jgi:hypothetical protein
MRSKVRSLSCRCEGRSANSPTVFQYKFFLPGDPDSKGYTVMWDYNIGLMRMTPFFKACKYQKVRPPDCSHLLVAMLTCSQTTPAKALKVNPGLIDLCHSITGGALTAQGYWVPFACARAVCLTFCYEIRWALSPIFGPDFVTQCLPPNHPNYKTFRINSSIVQHAAQEAESWRINASRSVTPAGRHSPATYGAGDNQRPLAPTSAPVYTPPAQELHPRRQAPEFRLGSPFAHNNQQGYPRSTYQQTPDLDEEPVSPKSSPMSRTFPPATSTWTSINRSSNYGSVPPSPPNNTPVNAYTPAHNHRGVTNSPGFRNAAGQRSPSPSHIPSQKVLDRASSRRPPPRRNQKISPNRRSDDDDFGSENVVASSSSSEVEAEVEQASCGSGLRSDMSIDSDSDNVVTSPPPSPSPPPSKTKKSKRSRRTEDEGDGENGNGGGREPRAKRAKELQWTTADQEAAHILMELNHEDAKLAYMKP